MLSVPQPPLLFLLCCCWLLVLLVVNTRISTEIQNLFIMCHRNCHLWCPQLSLVLLMSCFEPVVDCSEAGEVILGTLVNEKPAVTALDWQIKVPSYCLEKALSKQRTAVSLILLLLLPLSLWHPLRVRVHNFNPESCHNIQASHGHAFKLWKRFFFALPCCISSIFCHQSHPI